MAMKRMCVRGVVLLTVCAAVAWSGLAAAETVTLDFESLGLSTTGPDFDDRSDGFGVVDSSGETVQFPNSYVPYGVSYGWDGFSYSNVTRHFGADPVFPSSYPPYVKDPEHFDSQAYVAQPGGAQYSYGNAFAVANIPLNWQDFSYDPIPQRFDFGHTVLVESIDVTNTQYVYGSMSFGDGFAKQFGGSDGTDPDWLKVLVHGVRSDGSMTDEFVEILLADYTFEESSDDYMLDQWTTFDNLSALGAVNGLAFSMASSDEGDYGYNTPLYFAMDNLVYSVGRPGAAGVPEPASVAIWASALGLGLLVRRRRRQG